MNRRHITSGFTLVELLVVITIIALLATVGLVSYSSATKNARDARRLSDLERVRQALVLRRSDKGSYPSGTNWNSMINTLRTEGYLSSDAVTVKDPKDGDAIAVCGGQTHRYLYNSDGSIFSVGAVFENTNKTPLCDTTASPACTYKCFLTNP